MLRYPDHVGKALLFKIDEYFKVGKEKQKHITIAFGKSAKQDELLGEIKGMLQAEEFENEQRQNESKT